MRTNALKHDQIPTVLVALMVSPNQFCLFDEIEAEAVDIMGACQTSSANIKGSRSAVMLDCLNLRVGIAWSRLATGEVLTLSIGSQPGLAPTHDEARQAGDKLRQLVLCSEALFDVKQTLWQVAALPLDANTMAQHVSRIGDLEHSRFQEDAQFYVFEPDQMDGDDAAADPASRLLNGTPAGEDAPKDDVSWAMQASALALSSAFVLVTPPVGIAMFTYAALRQGTDMNLLPRNLDLAKWASSTGQKLSSVNKRGLKVSVLPSFE